MGQWGHKENFNIINRNGGNKVIDKAVLSAHNSISNEEDWVVEVMLPQAKGDVDMNKIVTICGSMKFKDKMMEVAKELEIKNKYVVIQCIYSNDKFSETEQQILADLHYNKIEISDAIYVINVNGYIGSSTSKEIEYAKKLGKEVMYLEPIK